MSLRRVYNVGESLLEAGAPINPDELHPNCTWLISQVVDTLENWKKTKDLIALRFAPGKAVFSGTVIGCVDPVIPETK